MTLWRCLGPSCGTLYAVGLFTCPRCKSTEFIEEGQQVPKATRYASEPEPVAEAEPVTDTPVEPEPADVPATDEGGEQPRPGTSSSTSSEPTPTTSDDSPPSAPKPARTTGSRSSKAATGRSRANGATTPGTGK